MIRSIPLKMLLALALLVACSKGFATTFTWVNNDIYSGCGDSGGDNSWNNSANWDEGGAGCLGNLPMAGDDVVFDGSYGPGSPNSNCTVDVNVSIASISITGGYSGTISFSSGITFTTSGSFSISSGTFTGNNGFISIGTTFTQTGGTFTKPAAAMTVTGNFSLSGAGSTFNNTASSGTLLFKSNFSQTNGTYNSTGNVLTAMETTTTSTISFTSSGGTFTHSANSFAFRVTSASTPATAAFTINNTPTFNSLSFQNSTDNTACDLTITIDQDIVSSGALSINTGTGTTGSKVRTIKIDKGAGGGTLTFNGTLTVTGNVNSTGGDGSGTLIMNAGTSISIANLTASGINPLCNFMIHGSTRTITLTGSRFLSIGTNSNPRTFTIMGSGDITLTAGTISCFGDVTLSNTGTAGGGTTVISIEGTGTQTLTGNSTAGQSRMPNLTINKSAGTLNLASTISMAGTTFTHTAGTISAGSSTMVFNGSCTISGAGTTSFNNLTISSGTLTGKSSANINVSGAWVNSGAGYTHNSGTVTFNGASASVSGATTTSFNHLTISSGVLTGSSGTMNVAGDWTNSVGSAGFVHNGGTVVFNGTGSQTITGATTFKNLTINNSKAATPWVTLASATEIIGTVDVQDGQLITAGLLTLNSDASGTACIGNLSDGTPEATAVSGNVICERYISESGSAKWHLLAAQTTGGFLSDWDDDIYYTGATFTGADYASGSFVNVLKWDETTDNDIVSGFSGATNTTNSLNNDGTTTGSLQSGFYVYDQFVAEVVDITGPVRSNAADVTFSLSFSSNDAFDGWHLIGNPHPCAVDWGNARKDGGSSTANISATARRMLASGSFGDLTATAADNTDLIASGEAIWVTATAAASLVIQEADKDPTGADSYNTKQSGSPLNAFKVTLSQGTYADAPVSFYFRNSYLDIPVTSGFDQLLDAEKLLTNAYGKENLAAVVDSKNISSGFFPDSVSSLTIPIRFWKKTPSGSTKTYTLSFENVALLKNENKCFSFEDTYAGVSFPLNADTTYSVTMKDTTYVPRFFLHLSSPITSSVVNSSCSGGGQAFIAATGSGSGPFNYIWKNQAGDTLSNVSSSVSDTIKNLSPGYYYLQVSNNGTCGTVSTDFEITAPVQITSSFTKSDLSCFGNSTGSASVNPSGGSSPYSYLWSSGSSSQNISSVPAGTYLVTITDAGSCSKVDSVTISQPSEISANLTSLNLNCFADSNGTAMTFASGGISPYTYLWSNGGTQSQILNLKAQTYIVTITDNANCTKVESVSVSEPTQIGISISPADVSCNGGSNGQLSTVVSGGTSDYSYLWSNGSTLASPQGLTSGNYTLTVTDANNCAKTMSATINQPAAPLSLSPSSSDVKCFGGNDGIASVSASGGTSGYTYLWSTGATSSQVSNLDSQTYSVTVTDSKNCTKTSSVLIDQPNAISLTFSPVNAKCNGVADGQAFVIATGGVSNYSYLWSGGGTTSTKTGLGAGTHTVTVTDNNNCSSTNSVTINEPSAIIISPTSTDATCGSSNGNASVTASGGTGNLAFLWSNGNQTNAISSLSAGTYTVTVTDGNNCKKTNDIIINNLTGPSVTASSTNILCNGAGTGTATATATGGASPLTYLWSNGSTQSQISNLTAQNYFVTVTDNNNCLGISSANISEPSSVIVSEETEDETCGNSNGSASVTSSGGTGNLTYLWSTGATTAGINSLASGSYSITVTDGNGCEKVKSMQVNNLSGPTVNVLSATDVSCNGGSNGQITTNPIGGTSPISFLWSNGNTNQNLSALPSGTYSLTVTDANNCTGVLTATVNEPAPIVITSSVTNATCGNSDGSAMISVSGGNGAYSYSWSNGESGSQVNNLSSGNYYVLVSDANGCSKLSTITITNTTGPIVNVSGLENPTCYGFNDGTVTASATGNGPFNFLWQNSLGDTLKNSANITGTDVSGNLSAGNYSVFVTDNSGCGTNLFIELTEPVPVVALFSMSEDTVDVAGGGTVNFTNSSSGANSYSWSFGDGAISTQFEPAHNYLQPGIYSVSLSAGMGSCNNSSQQTIVVINTVGLAEQMIAPKVFIFRTGNNLTVAYSFSEPALVEIELFNLLGQPVSQTKTFTGTTGKVEIKLPEQTGIYFLKVKHNNQEQVRKIFR